MSRHAHHDDHSHHHPDHRHPQGYPPGHGGHGHSHGSVDPTITTSTQGIWAIKWSFAVLAVTALLQAVVVWLSGSVSLLADTIHNFADAATVVPLWVAFALSRWQPSQRFTYGYGRVEDMAGVAVVLIMLCSAIVAGYETVQRFVHPQPLGYVGVVVAASVIGFLGNEIAAWLRIRVGTQIASAALIADGYHARMDAWTSLAVLGGAAGVWLGYPLADPTVGLLITFIIMHIVWQSSKAIMSRMLDGVEPHIIDDMRAASRHAHGVEQVTDVRARWLGHRLHAELNVAVAAHHSVVAGHAIAKEVRHVLLHHLSYLSSVMVHVDPTDEAGETFHRIEEHSHSGLAVHSH